MPLKIKSKSKTFPTKSSKSNRLRDKNQPKLSYKNKALYQQLKKLEAQLTSQTDLSHKISQQKFEIDNLKFLSQKTIKFIENFTTDKIKNLEEFGVNLSQLEKIGQSLGVNSGNSSFSRLSSQANETMCLTAEVTENDNTNSEIFIISEKLVKDEVDKWTDLFSKLDMNQAEIQKSEISQIQAQNYHINLTDLEQLSAKRLKIYENLYDADHTLKMQTEIQKYDNLVCKIDKNINDFLCQIMSDMIDANFFD